MKYINKLQVTCVDLCQRDNHWELFIALTSGKFETTQGTKQQMVDILKKLNSPDKETISRLVKISVE